MLIITLSLSANPKPDRGGEIIDIVYCLDLSASTNGLIDDVRDKLWDVINHVNSYRPSPNFRVGVVAFSRPSFGQKNYYVQVLSPLTNDFDALAYTLYKLRPSIEKGDQFVGKALQAAVSDLNWTNNDDAIKLIYVVGNGRVDSGGGNQFRGACENATKNGIAIHSLYCRNKKYNLKEVAGWREIARLSNGEQFDVKVNKKAPQVLVSEDQQSLFHLSEQLNSTYVYHGKNGSLRYKMMTTLDEHALKSSPMDFQSRLFYKISDHYQYHQSKWDLVDYLKSTSADFDKVKFEFLPDSLQDETPESLYQIALQLKNKRNIVIKKLRTHLPYNRQATVNRVYVESNMYQADIFDRIIVRSLDKVALTGGYNTGNVR